ncbi:hypothetical protein QBC42DRAFT_272228 [Cladorrhinum samala]|uniref:Uncharacterized protein n=1 Tax=Cladorrhinum samala TaxID=585594 RepID=A0AAV9HJE3_9PEZI|nr:hypothetical protein QBC42DRAFT_272228 [Cladorrhinum samala]
MDWINPDAEFTSHDLSTFCYLGQGDEAHQALVIWKTDDDERPRIEPIKKNGEPFKQTWKLHNDSDKTLHRSPCRAQPDLTESDGSFHAPRSLQALLQDQEPGSYVLICGRAPEVFEGQPSRVSDIPFWREEWESVTSSFHVHRTITRTILRDVAYVSSLRHTRKGSERPEISYTARMAASLPNDLALSTTYIPHRKTTFTVIYGANDDQTHSIWERIRSAGESIHHPLLALGIFMELERERLISTAEHLADQFTLGSDVLENRSWDPDNSKMQSYLEVCLRSRTLVDHMRAVKRQLAKVMLEIDELDRCWQAAAAARGRDDETRQGDLIKTGQQMKQRISDMLDEYDDKIDECKKMAQNLSLVMQTGFNQIARQDSVINTRISQANTMIALETKRESAQMRSIALLTMIYLPLSCVASVFSTTLFNWSPTDGEPIVSKHIWVLFAFAAVLTAITLGVWHFTTNRDKRKEDKRRESFRIGEKGDEMV